MTKTNRKTELQILTFIIITIMASSCNNRDAQIEEILNSIDKNMERSKELSYPSFNRDSAKIDYSFKEENFPEISSDSNLLEIIESAK